MWKKILKKREYENNFLIITHSGKSKSRGSSKVQEIKRKTPPKKERKNRERENLTGSRLTLIFLLGSSFPLFFPYIISLNIILYSILPNKLRSLVTLPKHRAAAKKHSGRNPPPPLLHSMSNPTSRLP